MVFKIKIKKLMKIKPIKLKDLKILSVFFIYLIGSFSMHAQYHIEGSEFCVLGETKSYSVEDDSENFPSSQGYYFYEWYANGGIITATNDTNYSAYGVPYISVTWNRPGMRHLFVDIHDGSYNDLITLHIAVNVEGTLPDDPLNPIINRDVCNPSITRSGTPPNGITWYWQGKNSNGSSISLGSGTTYFPTEGSGTYYIRARDNSNGIWSIGSASVEVTLTSKQLWYTDIDNDGFGDPNSTPVSSCTQPSGYVSNNFDQCPTQTGNPLNNGCPGAGDSGSTDKNWVHTITPLIGVSDVSQITNDDDKLESVTYFDGLGRPIQKVGIRAGGQKQDIKIPVIYDEFGRQAKTYLPHATVTSSVTSYTNNNTLINDLNSYYLSNYADQLNNSNPNAYSETRFDFSPLNRTLESGTPGEDWLIDPNSDNDHTTKYDYNSNTANEIYKINYPGAGQSLSIANFYTEGVLLKNTVKNANWVTADGQVNTKDVFTDKGGRKVAEYSYIKENSVLKALKTYYIYDNAGNMVYVLTPKLFTNLGGGTTISVTHLNNLAFQYKYDTYNRQIEQKVPGKKLWEYMVYDQLDRPILTQDKNLKDDGKWLFTKYDAFGRAIYSGLYTSSVTRDQLQTAVDNYISGNTNNLSNIESRTPSTSSVGGININYTNNAYPTTGLEVLTVNYYDDYTFTDADKPATPTSILDQTVTPRTKGLATASWTKTLGATSWAKTYSYYNEKGNLIYVYEKNYLGGYTENKSKLDFRGKVKASLTQHKRLSSNDPLIIKDYFTYDHAERSISHTQNIGGSAELALETIEFDSTSPSSDQDKAHIASNSIVMSQGFTALPGFHASIETFEERELIGLNQYDDLGHLTSKKIGGKADAVIANSNGLQTIDYKYDIRGALKAVNDVDEIGDDLFAYELNYESGEGTNFDSSHEQFNGNIAQMVWKSAHNNIKKSYVYNYDGLNRFTKASYGEGSSLTSNTSFFNAEVTGYDHNGNITGLTRTAASSSLIDNLSYHYDTGNGNQLMKIVDDAGTDGFTNGPTGSIEDYAYDDNGNLTKDLNKTISLIEYNHLDLVKKVTFSNGSKIEFLYDASGAKLQMKYTPNGSNPTITDYIGGFQYVGADLKFFSTPEGYVSPELFSGSAEYKYTYVLKDHLGNNRVAFKDFGGDNIVDNTDIISSTDYYPMGLIHHGEFVQNSDYNYKYQNKEKLLANDYNMYDFGSRMYDASVGRWFNTDPQNQFGSPYLAMGNNPVMMVDPDGELAWFVPLIAGAVIGGASTAIQNPRADLGDILAGAGLGAAQGAVTSGIGTATSGISNVWTQALVTAGAHGSFQGAISSSNGGDFWNGFAAGAASSLIGSATTTWGATAQIAVGGVSGGLASELTGGKFTEGFASGLMVTGLNHLFHRMQELGTRVTKAKFKKMLKSIGACTVCTDQEVGLYFEELVGVYFRSEGLTVLPGGREIQNTLLGGTIPDYMVALESNKGTYAWAGMVEAKAMNSGRYLSLSSNSGQILKQHLLFRSLMDLQTIGGKGVYYLATTAGVKVNRNIRMSARFFGHDYQRLIPFVKNGVITFEAFSH